MDNIWLLVIFTNLLVSIGLVADIIVTLRLYRLIKREIESNG